MHHPVSIADQFAIIVENYNNDGYKVVLWDWLHDKSIDLEHQFDEISFVRLVQSTNALLIVEGLKIHIWHISQLHITTHVVSIDMDGVGTHPVLATKLCTSKLQLTDVDVPKGNFIDFCNISDWLTIGISDTRVFWIKNGEVICSFNEWFGVGGRKSEGDELECLTAVAGNLKSLFLATNFGNIYVLHRESMKWIRTIPLGIDVEFLAAAPNDTEHIVAASVNDDNIYVVNSSTLQLFRYRSRKATPRDTCECCGLAKESPVEKNANWVVCEHVSSNSVCVRLKHSTKVVSLHRKSYGMCTPKLYQLNSLVLSGSEPNTLELYSLERDVPVSGLRVVLTRTFQLDAPCISFDVDEASSRNIVALSDRGTLFIFKISRSQSTPIQTVHFDPKPYLVSARKGIIALATPGNFVTFLLDIGHGDELKHVAKVPEIIRSIEWSSSSLVKINHIHEITLPLTKKSGSIRKGLSSVASPLPPFGKPPLVPR